MTSPSGVDLKTVQPCAITSTEPPEKKSGDTPAAQKMQRGAVSSSDGTDVERLSSPPTSFTVGGKTYETANARPRASLIRLAGSRKVPARNLGEMMVAGPQAFDEKAILKQPNRLISRILELGIEFTFAIGNL